LWFPQIPICLINWELSFIVQLRFGPLLRALIASLAASFRSRAVLQLEILALRHQIGVLQRSVKRPKLTPADRLLWAWLCEAWSDWRSALVIVKPETVVGWHRRAFRLVWTWKVRHGQPGRPPLARGRIATVACVDKSTRGWSCCRNISFVSGFGQISEADGATLVLRTCSGDCCTGLMRGQR
jgi:hypothetical protein